ncbi:MAG: ABC transporter permease [Patescibacteria group bacterium]|nr:ABC transporter permease [Patescibacteria group bacterium]
MDIIYILWLRQIKRYWRSKSRIFGSIGQPILFLVAFGFGMGSMFSKAGGGNYINFLAPGIIGQAIIFMAIFNGVELIWDRQFGFLKETLVAPVSRFKIIIGRTLGGATIATIQGIIVLLLTLIIGFKPKNLTLLPLVIFIMFLISLLYTSLGTAIACKLKDFHGFQLIMNFLVMPSFFLSGALFPIDQAPKLMKSIVLINPLTYGVDAMRQILSGLAGFSLKTDILVLTLVTIILLLICTRFFSKIQA